MEIYITNEDGRKLRCKSWHPSGAPRAVVFVCHGWAEHLEYYQEIADELTKIGCLVQGHDHIGHGKSSGIPVHVDDFNEYTRDVLQHIELIQEDYGHLPCFILGHSMGGLIALKATMQRKHYFKGTVLIAPLIRSDLLTNISMLLAKFSSIIFPYIYSKPLDLRLLTRYETAIKKMENDELRWKRGFRARWTVSLMSSITSLEESFGDIDWPFYLAHGDNDSLCNIQGSQAFFTRAKSTDKTFRVIEGAYHGLFIELPEVALPMISEVTEWIATRITQTPICSRMLLTRSPLSPAIFDESHHKIEQVHEGASISPETAAMMYANRDIHAKESSHHMATKSEDGSRQSVNKESSQTGGGSQHDAAHKKDDRKF